ncbi:hypothetical protein E2C01_094597 [Portunus trituberculatus]|uniref:Uncharacterized protein n=1 Tax=Portunus trituberculatus TaxID=210409 RepID=A0A5B7K237_PORTR|nr:hypothetical protein [Portunus trituberculatus]
MLIISLTHLEKELVHGQTLKHCETVQSGGLQEICKLS